MDRLYIVIPAYNEEENIEKVVDDWYPVVEAHNQEGNSRLIVIDDGSRDHTYEILQKLAEDRPLLVCLTKPNGGHGATVLYGYHYALENGADFVFQTDSDGQTIPTEFEPFWQLRNEYDLVIGNRRSREDGFSRIVVTKTLKVVIRLCFGANVMDANTPYRLMRAKPLAENIALIPRDFNLSNAVLTVLYAKKRQSLRYLPITFRPRQGGVNSINLRKIAKIGLRAMKDFRTINRMLKTIEQQPQK